MSYKGKDLSPQFKEFFRTEKRRITENLTKLGCSKIELDYGFYYFSGFFTSASGQVYYLSVSDLRHFPYERIMYRTAKDYKDYCGGTNQYVDKNEIKKMNLV